MLMRPPARSAARPHTEGIRAMSLLSARDQLPPPEPLPPLEPLPPPPRPEPPPPCRSAPPPPLISGAVVKLGLPWAHVAVMVSSEPLDLNITQAVAPGPGAYPSVW